MAMPRLADAARVTSPLDVLKLDRSASLAFGLAAGLSGALMFGFAGGLAVGLSLVGGLVGGFAGRIYGRAYGRLGGLLISRPWLALTGRLPWSLMAFLTDAHHRGLLRQVGGVHQFRHARLHDRLVAHASNDTRRLAAGPLPPPPIANT